MEKIDLLVLTSFALILVIASMAFASAHQMNYNENMQGRNSNFMSMHKANNYMHNSIIGNSRMNSQQNAYIYMPDHRNINAHMYRY